MTNENLLLGFRGNSPMSAARLPTRQAVDIRSHRRPSATARRQELELKLTDLQQHYAELRTEIFEAAQVHRRLCAPRQLRFGNFEVASEWRIGTAVRWRDGIGRGRCRSLRLWFLRARRRRHVNGLFGWDHRIAECCR